MRACSVLCIALALHCGAAKADAAHARTALRVCADPNNLPFSNRNGEGFENKLAELIARRMNRELEYTWWAQRRGFVRNTLRAGKCDLILGMPAASETALTTRAYYRSSYVFVTRKAANLKLHSLADARLKQLRIGVHTIGDDFSNVPPAHALSARGIIDNVRGYSIYGDYSRPDPPRELIDAVAQGEIDVAIAWGPLAGFFAQRATQRLQIAPIEAEPASAFPMTFSIAMAVRHGEFSFKSEIESILAKEQGAVQQLLRQFGVPLLPLTPAASDPPESDAAL
jgi:quinoprotein dehydrogenase-associated probable ABC transporter substrate-binding protein